MSVCGVTVGFVGRFSVNPPPQLNLVVRRNHTKVSNSLMKLREHKIILQGERVTLRPMTEDDWDILLRWNSDPDVLYFAEGDDVRSYSLEQIQQIYRGVSQNAFCFIIEVAGNPIGECWLQQMKIRSRCLAVSYRASNNGLWKHGQSSTRVNYWRTGNDYRPARYPIR